jgi:hypothetical protein
MNATMDWVVKPDGSLTSSGLRFTISKDPRHGFKLFDKVRKWMCFRPDVTQAKEQAERILKQEQEEAKQVRELMKRYTKSLQRKKA